MDLTLFNNLSNISKHDVNIMLSVFTNAYTIWWIQHQNSLSIYNLGQNSQLKGEITGDLRNSRIFKILLLIPLYQCWIWPSFVVKILKLCKQPWLEGERGFYTEKKKIFFVSTVLSNTVVTQVSLEISGKMIIRKIL